MGIKNATDKSNVKKTTECMYSYDSNYYHRRQLRMTLSMGQDPTTFEAWASLSIITQYFLSVDRAVLENVLKVKN